MDFVASVKIWALVAAIAVALLTVFGQYFVYRKYGLSSGFDKMRQVYWPLTNALAAACVLIAVGIGVIVSSPVDSRWAQGVAPLIQTPQVGGEGPIGGAIKNGLQPFANDLARQANESLKPVQALQGAQALIGDLLHLGVMLAIPLALLIVIGVGMSVMARRAAFFKVRVQAGEINRLKGSVEELQRAVFPHKFN